MLQSAQRIIKNSQTLFNPQTVEQSPYKNCPLLQIAQTILNTPQVDIIEDMRNLLYTIEDSKFIVDNSCATLDQSSIEARPFGEYT